MKKRKRLEVVECEGTPFEIGRRYGSACKESLISSIEALFDGVGMLLPTGKPSRQEVVKVVLKYLPLVEAFDPLLIEILKGQAAGAGVEFEEVFALRCKFELGICYPTLMGATGTSTAGGYRSVAQRGEHPAGRAGRKHWGRSGLVALCHGPSQL